jgi:NarL family two-component system response regulator LiaR
MVKIKILLADDHVVVRQGIREVIQHETDMEIVGEAGDGEEAMKQCIKLHPDVVVMDIVMPNVDGIEATKQIKAKCPDTAVLILTAYDDDQYIFASLEAHVAGYLLKTVSGQELISTIRAIRSGESVLKPSIARKVIERYNAAMRPRSRGLGDTLTKKEMDVLRLVAKGITNNQIAEELDLKVQTVRSRIKKIFKKLNVATRTEAAMYAMQKGWISLHEVEKKH